MDLRVVFAAAMLMAVAMAGCTEAGEGTGAIRVVSRPDDAATQPFVLEAAVAADEYSWEMGDGRPKLSGQRVEHVYGVQQGTFTVKLTTVTAGEATTHDPLKLEFGAGTNAAPDLVMAFEWLWVQVGENVTISGARSSDPDGDPLLFDFFCQRKSDIALAGAGHAHAGAGGVQYGSGSAAVIPVVALNGTDVPQASGTVAGDFCAGMSRGAFTEDGTIRGAFERNGLYEVTMLAKDPGHPALPGAALVYVSDAPRQTPWENHTFDGDIQLGAPESADGPAGQAGMQDHIVAHDFVIKYPILGIKAAITHDGGDGVPVQITYELRKGSSVKVPATSDPLDKGADFLSPGSYTAVVALRQGSNVHYELAIELVYETDPAKVFEGPH